MRTALWVVWSCLMLLASGLFAQETADSLGAKAPLDSLSKAPVITYVIPAGPEAGSFTESSRLQVVDTVAGWAKVLVEGWVPVEYVLPRMTSETPVLVEQPQQAKKTKAKKERTQCIVTTLKGERCKRKAVPGTNKCWQHSN